MRPSSSRLNKRLAAAHNRNNLDNNNSRYYYIRLLLYSLTRGELYTCCIVVIGVILDQYCPLDITVEVYKSEFAFPLFQDQQEAIDQVTNPRRPLSSTFCQINSRNVLVTPIAVA